MKIQNAFRLGLVGTLGVGLGILILASIVSLSTIITYIGAALFLSLGLDPAVTLLEKLRFPRWAAIVTVLVVVIGAVVGIVFAIVPIITSQVSELVRQIPGIVNTIQKQDWIGALNNQFGSANVSSFIDSVTAFVTDPSKITGLANGVLAVGFAVISGVFGAIIIGILTIYFTASLPSIKRGLYQLVPATKRARFADLAEQISKSVGRYVMGQFALALCNGVLSFIFLSIIHAPFTAVLAFIAFLFSLLPLVGTLTGSVIIVLTCLIPFPGLHENTLTTAIAAAIYYVIYMQVEAYILSPNIMNRAVQVPGSLVVIAALAGGSLLGILGALIAIPVAAAVLLIIKQVVIPHQNEL
ncbi:AI-2E family transporter [Microbacterium sp. STN6]|uniref:AI-2E family transporter n=1 Tax=Microbacterium sp. STN6 TaxID=2995588 RepID=UPI002260970E|nr:AI-2E family transporter [Microbacterium sp. STN6]MCX7522141.1 AI-2E family transporter [Microbacterium sp. STN6]